MILITGGAGYIGSQIARDMAKNGHKIVVIDNLELGHKKSISGVENITFIKTDFSDKKILSKIFADFPIKAVMHIAAYSEVGESINNSEKYFTNNLKKSAEMLDAMIKANIKKIIFSSTAAVYGEPEQIPITENTPANPINSYGKSKLEFEKILSDYSRTKNLDFIALRYFNAAGAELDGSYGEDHSNETHLIPRLMKFALGKIEKFEIFGNDYPTPDGTCIRDYIHIKDISQAHILAYSALSTGKRSNFYNIGTGKGLSVKEIISETEKITGKNISVPVNPRRAGDPAVLITGNEKIKKELGWDPQYSNIKTIISSAWKWHSSHPNGYDNAQAK